MKILGISGSLTYSENHDASACLLIDGKMVGNYEEERFNRVKHSVGLNFPINCIHKLLDENGLTINDIDVIGAPCDVRNKSDYIKQIVSAIDSSSTHIPELVYKSHHIAHACDSFYQSGFKSACAVIIDGSGDNKDGISIFHFKNEEIIEKYKIPYFKSLGLLYYAGTDFAGFPEFSEGKFMGLSSYGKPICDIGVKWENNDIKIPFDVPENFDNYYVFFNGKIKNYFKSNCYPYEASSGMDDAMYYCDIAASIQKTFNDITLEIIKYAKSLTNEDNLVLSGGCIQNCIANNLIVESGIFKNVYASPAPHDGGCAAGLAYYAAHKVGEKIENKRLTNSYVGKTYSDDEILSAIDTSCYTIEDYNIKKVTKYLNSGAIIGWFQNGSEIGPRALGHRSIIAIPSIRDNLNIINTQIKHRENWRPLAPTVPEELFDMIFDTKSKDLTEFMLRTLKIRPEWRKTITAVCHIDNTTRPQCLKRDVNNELYDLIMFLYKMTNVPCIINTSFNDRGQPIIETPAQAMEFLDTHDRMDVIIFNAKYVVYRKNN